MVFKHLFLFIVGMSAFGSDSIKVERFGIQGDLTPTFLGQPLPDHFFTSHKTKPLTSGRYYTATMVMPKATEDRIVPNSKRGLVTQIKADPRVSKQRVELLLINESEHQNDVVLSATRAFSNEVANFALSIPANGELFVDVSSLSEFDDFFFYALLPFRAFTEVSEDGSLKESLEIETMEPKQELSASKSANYCSDRAATKKLIAGTTSVIIYAKKTFWVSTPFEDLYFFEIYYLGSKFHSHFGQIIDGINCTSSTYNTRHPSTFVENSWSNVDDGMLDGSTIYGCLGIDVACNATNFDWKIVNIF